LRLRNISEGIQINPKSRSGLTLEVGAELLGELPSLGTGIASHGGTLTPQEIGRLKALQLSHLRADIWFSNPGYPDRFRKAVDQSQSLGVPLHLALHLSDKGEAQLQDLQQIVGEFLPNISLWLVYPAKEIYHSGSPIAQVVAWVRKSKLARDSPSSFVLASGTDHDFIFLQRNLPPTEQIDKICFSINPQVHAFDNASIMETLETQSMAVISARHLSCGLPVVVSPVTLRPRYNPYATGDIPPKNPGELPPQVDYRQPSLFTAAWLVGSIRAMTEGGASTITYFETTGWRGILERDTGSPIPEKFYSIPGAVFPVYHIFADIADFKSSGSSQSIEVLTTKTSDALKIQALALRKNKQKRLLVANLKPENQSVTVSGLPTRVSVRSLDHTNAEKAMRTPEVYRLKSMAMQNLNSGILKLDLFPYAVVTIDF
jgi:hypothetical protein